MHKTGSAHSIVFSKINSKLLLLIAKSLTGYRLDECGSNPGELQSYVSPHQLKNCFAFPPSSYPLDYISDIGAGHSPQALVSGNLVMLTVRLL